MRRLKSQTGQTLIELMVSMALGLVISGAAIQLFLANQITVNFQRGMNDVQANGRFALDLLTRSSRLAGLNSSAVYTDVSGKAIIGVVTATTDVPGLAATSTNISRNDVVAAGISNSDQLVVQYLGMANMVDCEGNDVVANRFVIERYFVRTDAVTNTPALACDAGSWYIDGTGTPQLANYGDAGQVLVAGVDSFQVMYGVDNGADGTPIVNQYVNANTYTTTLSTRKILAIRIGLYLHSMERAGDAAAVAGVVPVLDSQIAAGDVPNDSRMRRLFISTIALRNVDATGV